MNIVITGSMCQLQHHRLNLSRNAILYRILRYIIDYASCLVTVRICLRSIHIALGIMSIIQEPVIYTRSGDTVMELVGSSEKDESRHHSTIRETLDTDFLVTHIWLSHEPVCPIAEVLKFHNRKLTIDHVKSLTTVMSLSTRIDCDLDDFIIRIPLIA